MSNLKKTSMKTSSLSPRNLLKKFRRDNEGVAAIEFALIAPILIIMYLGLLEICMGIMADRDVSHAANVAGDLATQVEILEEDEIANILTAAVAVMGPRPKTSGDIRIHIESYDLPSAGNPRSLGKATIGDPVTKGVADLQELEDMNLLTTTSGVVIATINYDYTPVGTTYLADNITLFETFVLKPRRSASIPMQAADGTQTDFTFQVNDSWVVTKTSS